MRIPLSIIAILLVGISARAADAPQQTSQRPPNILLILSDDQSVPHCGCYGNPDVHTPNIDKLASQGMRFDRAYTAAPQCVPSRASILTGRHPIDIGMTRFSAPLPNDVVTFPELLRKQANYYIGLSGRTYHLQGNLLNRPNIRPYLRDEDIPDFAKRYDFLHVVDGEDGTEFRTKTIDTFREFLGRVPKDKPFFLEICWHDPHRPFTSDDLPFKHDPAKLTLPPFYPDSPAIRADLAAYYDEVGRMDGNTGTLLEILDQHKLAENTIVIFMGDNGSSQYRGKGTLNELGLHVPLVIRWPGVITAGSSNDALVSGEDLAPTLLEVAGAPLPSNLTGVSFLPLLHNENFPNRRKQFIAERGPHASSLPKGSASFDLGRSITTDRYKLIYNAMWQLPYQPVDYNLDAIKALDAAGKLEPKFKSLYLAEHRPMFELYDLKNDPWEMTNLIDKPEVKDIQRELKGRLSAWMIQHRDFIPLPVGD